MSRPIPYDKEILEYLCRPETIREVLAIVRKAPEIRSRIFGQFWLELKRHLEANIPRASQGTSLAFELWPADVKRIGNSGAGLYYWDKKLAGQADFLSFYIYQENRYFYYGIDWEKPQPKSSRLWKLSSVQKLTELLKDNGFNATQWSLAWKEIYRRDSGESFLLEYFDRKGQILGEISESFWALVKEAAPLVAAANRELSMRLK
jgi:hypothetical protein